MCSCVQYTPAGPADTYRTTVVSITSGDLVHGVLVDRRLVADIYKIPIQPNLESACEKQMQSFWLILVQEKNPNGR